MVGNDGIWLCPGAPTPVWLLGVTANWIPTARTRAVRDAFSLQGYGRAQHSISTEKIKSKYPDYEVTWADDGY